MAKSRNGKGHKKRTQRRSERVKQLAKAKLLPSMIKLAAGL